MNPVAARELWIAQSKLLWGRIKTVSVIEAGTLSAWYVVRNEPRLSYGIIALGFFLLLAMALIARRDGQYMEACEHAAGDEMPKVSGAFLNLSGRTIAVAIPLILALANLGLLCM